MEDLSGRLVVAVASVALTALVSRFVARRSVFAYTVRTDRIATSADDSILGSVGVTWRGTPVSHLFLSVIDLVNESARDHEKVVVRVVAAQGTLLGEQVSLVGSTRKVQFTDTFVASAMPTPGGSPTSEQAALFARLREYEIPTLNRRGKVQFIYSIHAAAGELPRLELEVDHTGVVLRPRRPRPQVLGVSTSVAGGTGVIVGILGLWLLVTCVHEPWAIGAVAFAYGCIAQVPGAAIIRVWRWLRGTFEG